MGPNDEEMDQRATAFIESLAARSAGTGAEDTWYCIAACAFAASNQGKYVATIFTVAIRPRQDDTAFHRLILRRIKEALLKTGIIYGIPRLINAFRSLMTALPSPDSNETSSLRAHITTPSTTDARGLAYMRTVFGADLDPFLAVMDGYWPDLRTLVVTTVYGYYQSDTTVLGAVATSQCNVASLVPMDVVAEAAWHMRGLVRHGGTRGQLDEAFGIAREVACGVCGVVLRNEMPRPEEVVAEERLF